MFNKESVLKIEKQIQKELKLKKECGYPLMINNHNDGAIERVGYKCNKCETSLTVATQHRPLAIYPSKCPDCNDVTYIMTIETIDN